MKTCKTCAYRSGTFAFGKCMLSGYYCTVERKHPSVCGRKFENWVQRDTVYTRFKSKLAALIGRIR